MSSVAKCSLISFLSMLVALPIYAHHSFSQFDDKVCKTITGTVRKFEFSYPHTWLWVDTLGEDGTSVLFGFEGADPATLALYGWSQKLLKKADKVSVDFNPLRDGRNGGSMRNILLPSGESIGTQGDEYVFAKCVKPETEGEK